MAKTINMPNLPAMPSSKGPRRLSACHCGCGGTTYRTFVPGHDSKLKGWILRVELGVIELPDLNDWPNIKAVVAKYVAMRKAGKNPSFMANVELPTEVKATGTK